MDRVKLYTAVFILLALTACVAVIGAAGAGGALGYRYIKGELKISYNRSFDSVWTALNRSLEDLKVKVLRRESDGAEGLIIGRTGLGKKVRIHVKYNGRITKVSIRVGTLGDMDYSLAIKYRMESYLKGGGNGGTG